MTAANTTPQTITCGQCRHFSVPASAHTPNPYNSAGMGNCAYSGGQMFISGAFAGCQFKPILFEPRQEPDDVAIPTFIQSRAHPRI